MAKQTDTKENITQMVSPTDSEEDLKSYEVEEVKAIYTGVY